MKFVSWNIRGLGQEVKKKAVKDLVLKLSPTVLALVETKQPEPTLQLIRQIWGHKPTQRAALSTIGASSGIWVVWNPLEHTLISSHLGDFLVTVLLSSIPAGSLWKFTAVYGPNISLLRPRLWFELDHVAALPHPLWCLGGDFNVTRWSYEQNSFTSISQDMRDFTDFLTRNELIDSPLQWSQFTWSNHSPNPTLSKLDCFLFSTSWEECFPGSIALALPKPGSDHCPILLDTNAVQRGPKPFRFELAWLQETPLASVIPTWWASFTPQVRGRAGYKLQTKNLRLKTSLKTWSKILLGNYSKTKSLLLDSIQNLDHLEETRALDTSKLNLRAQTKLDYLATLKKEEIF
ncbi:hypothetical protein AMTRI_Chr06g194310 [Amborella trichopoda]